MAWYALLIVGVIFTQNCLSQETILVATKNVIRSFSLTQFDSGHSTYYPIEADNIADIDYDPVNAYLYWIDKETGRINKAKTDGTGSTEVYRANNPISIALDIASQVIYWTDTVSNTIEQVSFDGSGHKSVADNLVEKPMSIALDVKNGKMYWSEVGPNPHIARANLDGSDLTVLVSSSKPRALTLDLDNNKLYWVDDMEHKVKYSDLDGKNVQELLSKENVTASAIAIHGNKIYCTDTGRTPSQVWTHDAVNGDGDVDVILTLPYWKFTGIYATKTKNNEEIIFVAQESGIMELDLSVEKGLGKQIEPLAMETALAITYDDQTDKIYWITTEKQLKSANRNGSDITMITKTKFNKRGILQLDQSKGQIFWSEKNQKKIRMLSLNGGTPTDVVTSDLEILGFDLDTENSEVYWVEDSTTAGKIRKKSYGISATTEDIATNQQSPTAVIVDTTGGNVYWSLFDSSKIMKRNANGELGEIAAHEGIRYMTLLGNTIYWYASDQNLGMTNVNDGKTAIIQTQDEREFKSLKIIPATDACTSGPCQNGGTCVLETGGYSCTCPSGYEGKNCETATGACASNPCKNGGTCVLETGGYSCTCQSGYQGDNCETATGACASNPCKNGGTCVLETGGYSCTCQSGYQGDNCETAPDPCSNDPCKNGGTCTADGSGYSCTCQSEYGGDNCETVLGVCANNPCKNGGTCIKEASGYKCTCAIGFIGANCEIGLVYIALIIPIIALIALIAYCVKKKSNKARNVYGDYYPQGAPNLMYTRSDIIVQPMYI